MCGTHTHGGDGLGLGFGRLADRAGGDGLAGGPRWLVVGHVLTCSRARSAGRVGPEGFVGLPGLVAPALLGWGRRVTVSGWVGKIGLQNSPLSTSAVYTDIGGSRARRQPPTKYFYFGGAQGSGGWAKVHTNHNPRVTVMTARLVTWHVTWRVESAPAPVSLPS